MLVDHETGEPITSMSCPDFAEHLWDTYDFHTFLSELRFSDDYSAETCLLYMQQLAERENVTLTGLDDWDYDREFWTMYRESRQ